MFDDIGQKCKTVAQAFCWLGIIASIIVGVICFFVNPFGYGLVIGLTVMLLGSLVSWLGSIGLYGIGEAAENSAEAVMIAKRLEQDVSSQKSEVTSKFRDLEKATVKGVNSNTNTNESEANSLPFEQTQGSCSDEIPIPVGQIKCAKCGTAQWSDRKVCWRCGARLVHDI